MDKINQAYKPNLFCVASLSEPHLVMLMAALSVLCSDVCHSVICEVFKLQLASSLTSYNDTDETAENSKTCSKNAYCTGYGYANGK